MDAFERMKEWPFQCVRSLESKYFQAKLYPYDFDKSPIDDGLFLVPTPSTMLLKPSNFYCKDLAIQTAMMFVFS